jgi:TolA-binding protein
VLHFSDGSEVTLSERSRLHVRAIDEHGARVTLDEGQAHVYVVHAPGTRWSFDAGPFVVAVTGTAFGISWDPNERRLDVRLENGSVTVSGPTSDAPISLRAGQWLIERPNEVFIRSADDSEAYAADDAGNPALDAPDAGPNGREAPPQVVDVPAAPPDRSARHAASKADHRWRRALANGQFETIIADAERRGVEVTLANGSAEDLTALADAARYTRRPALARKALFALRQRFPGAAEAHLAAFSLGRLAESEGDRRNAQSWLETYLAEAPEGTYAAEALGRKMEIVRQGEGNAAARPVAEDYIRRFPDSPYSEAARSILARP